MDFLRVSSFFTFLLLIVSLCVCAIKPTNLAKEVVCEGCHAVITESSGILGSGKRGSSQVKQAVQNACQINRLTRFEFSPPNMVKACNYWKDNYRDELIEVLSAGGDDESQEIQLCFVVTDVCQGVDRTRFRINKYTGPSKTKIRAALAEDEGEEEVLVDQNEETGEDAVTIDDADDVPPEKSEPEAANKGEDAIADEGEVEKEQTEDKISDDGDDDVGEKKAKDHKKGKGEKDGKKDTKKDKGDKKEGKKDKEGIKDKGGKKGKEGKEDKEGKKDKSKRKDKDQKKSQEDRGKDGRKDKSKKRKGEDESRYQHSKKGKGSKDGKKDSRKDGKRKDKGKKKDEL